VYAALYCSYVFLSFSAIFVLSIASQSLWETGMFRFSDADNYQVTPPHLAASTGNTDVVRYLLRANVSTFTLQHCLFSYRVQLG